MKVRLYTLTENYMQTQKTKRKSLDKSSLQSYKIWFQEQAITNYLEPEL